MVALAEAVPLDEKALAWLALETMVPAPFNGSVVLTPALAKAGLPVTVVEKVCGLTDRGSGCAAAPETEDDAELVA